MSSNESSVNILFWANNYYPKVGGLEKHVQELAEELVRTGNRATVVTIGDEYGDEFLNGVRIIRLKRGISFGEVFSFPKFRSGPVLFSAIAEEQFSVVSTHTRFFPLSWLGAKFALKNKIPRIHTEHGSGFVKGVSWPVGVMSKIVDVTLGVWTLRTSTKVVGVSESSTKFVKSISGVDASVFYNAIPEIKLKHLATDVIPQSTKMVFIGRLVPGKGADASLNLLFDLSEQTVDECQVRLSILGDGPERLKLEQIAKLRGIIEFADFRGRVSSEEVYLSLKDSVYVNPTTLSEGFQTTLLEALAAGASIVTYPVPGAALLQSQGAPIIIVRPNEPAEFSNAVKIFLSNGWTTFDPKKLVQWMWPERAKEYLSLCSEVSL